MLYPEHSAYEWSYFSPRNNCQLSRVHDSIPLFIYSVTPQILQNAYCALGTLLGSGTQRDGINTSPCSQGATSHKEGTDQL